MSTLCQVSLVDPLDKEVIQKVLMILLPFWVVIVSGLFCGFVDLI